MRRSFDGLESLTSSLASGFTGRGLGALGVGVGVRASWTPTISPLDARERLSAGKTGKGNGRYVNWVMRCEPCWIDVDCTELFINVYTQKLLMEPVQHTRCTGLQTQRQGSSLLVTM